MPTLPTYESKRNIQTQSVSPKVTPVTGVNEVAPVKGMVEAAETLQPALQGAGEVIGAWQKAQDTMDYTKFKADISTRIAQQKSLADQDPNPDNAPTHLAKLSEIKKDALNVFRNKELATRAGFELDNDIQIAGLEIGNGFRKKQLIQNESALYTFVETASNNIVNAPTQIMANQERQKAEAVIQANLQNGTITPEKANKLKNDLRLNPIELYIYANPEQGKANVEAGLYDLNAKEKADMIDLANKQIKAIRDIDSIDRIRNRFSIVSDISQGKMDLLKTKELAVNIGIKDPKLGEAISKATEFKGSYLPEDKKNQAFSDLARNIFTTKTQEEVSNFIVEALHNSTTGEMSGDRMAILVSAAIERANTLKPLNDSIAVTPDPKQSQIASSIQNIIKNSNPLFSTVNMIVNFLKAVNSGKEPVEAHSDAVKSEANRVNPISVKYKVGDIITNPKTGQSVEVMGFNANGNPIVKRRVSGK